MIIKPMISLQQAYLQPSFSRHMQILKDTCVKLASPRTHVFLLATYIKDIGLRKRKLAFNIVSLEAGAKVKRADG